MDETSVSYHYQTEDIFIQREGNTDCLATAVDKVLENLFADNIENDSPILKRYQSMVTAKATEAMNRHMGLNDILRIICDDLSDATFDDPWRSVANALPEKHSTDIVTRYHLSNRKREIL